MGMSGNYGPRDDAESERTIARAIELGITLIDTADVYGLGHNEMLLGRALRGRRERVVLATKFAFRHSPDGAVAICGRPDYVREACDASLAQGENLARNVAIVDALGAIAAELGANAAQVALAWVLAQGDDIVPIPGTKRVRYVEENAAAVDLTLSPAHLARIAAVAPKGAAAGSRISGNSPSQRARAQAQR